MAKKRQRKQKEIKEEKEKKRKEIENENYMMLARMLTKHSSSNYIFYTI